jgi:hypothetical protein
VHTHFDPAIGLTWQLKDSLPEKKLVFYSRVLRRLPTFISLDYLPCFYRLFAPAFDRDPAQAGEPRSAGVTGRIPMGSVSMPARGILDPSADPPTLTCPAWTVKPLR